jgi:hypothetical protein
MGMVNVTRDRINDLCMIPSSWQGAGHCALGSAPCVAQDTEKWRICRAQNHSGVGHGQARIAAFIQCRHLRVEPENVQWLIEKSGVPFDFDMLVIDELSSFKNHQSKRFRSLRRSAQGETDRGLTGTPSSNGYGFMVRIRLLIWVSGLTVYWPIQVGLLSARQANVS